MIKRILIYALILISVFFSTYFLHNFLISETLSFKLWQVYFFHVIAAFLVYICVEVVAENLPNQAGYAYLMLMFFKIGAFVLIFQESVFAKDSLLQVESVALVVPLFLFLMLEAIAVAKLLNSK
ncbi:DUF6168 family protein [Neotamlana laminarinivorans]|uniref:DUF6168 family protein n=1 Tax=Neotamlana laminarinivorans TaxID=2883124 RepID=A0A9X1HY92_9FLAO|nr:DUF6168 family protein [Tamlana laminarinivorans]MCB4798353.1 DUF6168 family protein [Tamlana laminarinivorans]